jgi:hypothetical protein
MRYANHSKVYDVFGRELSARIAHHGLRLGVVAKKAEVSESAIKSACSGIRPLSPSVLEKIVGLLVDENEHPDYVLTLLTQICKPSASRTYFARGLLAPIRVGYLESRTPDI